MMAHIEHKQRRVGDVLPRPRWNVLIVDDDVDVHSIVRLALRRHTLHGARLSFTSAQSASQARTQLLGPRASMFDIALVDCVMESNTAGLELCQSIRASHLRDLPIIMMCGGFGEAFLRSRYGDVFDTYLPKSAMSADNLYRAIDAGLGRSRLISPVSASSITAPSIRLTNCNN